MTYDEIADEFLADTDALYRECQQGISTLDKLIVGTPSIRADYCRMALVPALYAYWERFFRTVFGDFLRCVGLAGASLSLLCEPLATARLSREIKNGAWLRAHHTLHQKLAQGLFEVPGEAKRLRLQLD